LSGPGLRVLYIPPCFIYQLYWEKNNASSLILDRFLTNRINADVYKPCIQTEAMLNIYNTVVLCIFSFKYDCLVQILKKMKCHNLLAGRKKLNHVHDLSYMRALK
jgi:hypothetical protein